MATTIIPDLDSLSAYVAEFLQAYKEGGVFGLVGDLGAGKTTFVRLVVEHLAHDDGRKLPRVISPTYVLHQSYNLLRPVEHFDLYRLDAVREAELAEMGYFDALQTCTSKNGLLFVEWPDKVAPTDTHLLELTKTINVKIDPSGQRLYTIAKPGN